MIKAEQQVMEAFVSPQGQVIKAFLEKCTLELMSKMLVAEGNELYRAQGATQELNEIVELANNSRNILHS